MTIEELHIAIAIADRIGDADEVTRLRALLPSPVVAETAPAPLPITPDEVV